MPTIATEPVDEPGGRAGAQKPWPRLKLATAESLDDEEEDEEEDPFADEIPRIRYGVPGTATTRPVGSGIATREKAGQVRY